MQVWREKEPLERNGEKQQLFLGSQKGRSESVSWKRFKRSGLYICWVMPSSLLLLSSLSWTPLTPREVNLLLQFLFTNGFGFDADKRPSFEFWTLPLERSSTQMACQSFQRRQGNREVFWDLPVLSFSLVHVHAEVAAHWWVLSNDHTFLSRSGNIFCVVTESFSVGIEFLLCASGQKFPCILTRSFDSISFYCAEWCSRWPFPSSVNTWSVISAHYRRKLLLWRGTNMTWALLKWPKQALMKRYLDGHFIEFSSSKLMRTKWSGKTSSAMAGNSLEMGFHNFSGQWYSTHKKQLSDGLYHGVIYSTHLGEMERIYSHFIYWPIFDNSAPATARCVSVCPCKCHSIGGNKMVDFPESEHHGQPSPTGHSISLAGVGVGVKEREIVPESEHRGQTFHVCHSVCVWWRWNGRFSKVRTSWIALPLDLGYSVLGL